MGLMFSSASALKLSNTLSESYNNIMETSQRLSTGVRLNSSEDGAAELVIADNFKLQAAEINTNLGELQQAKTFTQILETDYEAVTDYLENALEKLEAANNELLTDEEIMAYVYEAQEYLMGTENISNTSSYKDTKLLDGNAGILSFGSGDYSISFDGSNLFDVDFSDSVTVTSAQSKSVKLSNLASDIDTIKSNLSSMNEAQRSLGTKMARLDSRVDSMLKQQEGYVKTDSAIRDADVAAESAKQIKAQVLYQTASNLFADMTESSKSRAISIINSAGIY